MLDGASEQPTAPLIIKKNKFMKNWLDVTFQSSEALTPQFVNFNKQVKAYIKKLIKNDFELASWSKGHFEFGGFLKHKSGKYVYFSSDDVRFSPNGWYNNLLIRTAENDKDYTGGNNCFCKLDDLLKKALELV